MTEIKFICEPTLHEQYSTAIRCQIQALGMLANIISTNRQNAAGNESIDTESNLSLLEQGILWLACAATSGVTYGEMVNGWEYDTFFSAIELLKQSQVKEYGIALDTDSGMSAF